MKHDFSAELEHSEFSNWANMREAFYQRAKSQFRVDYPSGEYVTFEGVPATMTVAATTQVREVVHTVEIQNCEIIELGNRYDRRGSDECAPW